MKRGKYAIFGSIMSSSRNFIKIDMRIIKFQTDKIAIDKLFHNALLLIRDTSHHGKILILRHIMTTDAGKALYSPV